MKKQIFIILLLGSLFASAQSVELANNYFDRGEFDKAISIYEEILQKAPNNYTVYQKIVESYQQLKQYDKSEKIIFERLNQSKNPTLNIELGFNFQLQKNTLKANEQYNLAIEQVALQSNYAYSVAAAFEKKSLIDWAIKSYEVGVLGNPNLNFDYQIALLQGQNGNLELMVDKLLDYSFTNQNNVVLVQNQLTRFMTDSADETFSDYIRKALLIRVQKSQDIFWNQFLSWYFVQQKEYGKAFVQEKAIYKRNPEGFNNIISLAQYAMQENESETAKTIFEFVLENTQDFGLQIAANIYLMNLEIDKALPEQYPTIQTKIATLMKQFGTSPFTLELQILSAHFDAFYLNQLDQSKATLENALTLNISPRQQSQVKMELADILVFSEKFNQAILYYAQITESLKNDEKSHEASMKMAKASYYKQDFDWALQQVKVLKQSPSLLIANDAIELFLLISDNSAEDSLRLALKSFAKADLKMFQNKNDEALVGFLTILEQHKDDVIIDGTLYKIAKIYEKKKDFNNALKYYNLILENHSEGIYVDEALYFSAEIYRKELNESEKAKPLYEKMIFNHQDSIYFTDARKQYRLLRGDTI